jgi:crotonobetainyl-CoA:carnitine CoA-transferase CaiB-like acyl-CoA transferase
VAHEDAPLAGLRVLELASGVAGPYAGRLLAMLGATVVKVEPPGGDPARAKPVDDEPIVGPSPLYLHLNAGKLNASAATVGAATWDAVIDDRVRHEVAGTDVDPGRPGGPLLISVTPFGFDAEEGGGIEHEVLAQARSGLIGVQGDPGREPLRLPGWQAQYQAGALAAVAVLAGVRLPGVRHIDVSWTACLMTGCELHYADAIAAGVRWPPTGSFPITAFPGGALACRDGFVVPGSFRDIDWETQCLLYDLPELIIDERYRTRAARAERVEEVWDLIRPWYAERTKDEIFDLALDTPWTVGRVMTASEALDDRHLVARQFFGALDTPEGEVRAPVRPFRTDGLPVADQRVRVTGDSDADDAVVAARRSVTRTSLDGLRLLEVTTAWAGPYVGNMLGALGVDVVKLEALPPFDGYRVLRLHADSDPPSVLALKADNRWFEASALHNAVNRNKRGAVIDLRAEDGRELFLGLARTADAVLCNFTAKVLPELGLGFDDLAAVNPGIVVVRMPAFGTVGPYSAKAGYGPVVEGMGGLGARFGYEHEGARITDLYWPDPVAGAHAALAIMSGVERRDRTGVGCEIDLAHMEVMWNALGEGIIVADQRGREIGRMGNREPGVATSGFVAAADGRWVAVIGDASAGGAVAALAGRPWPEVVAAVRAAGGHAEVVNEILDALEDPRLTDRFEVVDHPVTGPRRQVRSPFVIDGDVTTTRRRAPLFDEHTDEILNTLARCAPEQLAALRSAGVIGGVLPPPSAFGL